MTPENLIDLKQAEEDPTSVFASPQDVVRHGLLSRAQKLRILRRWKLDALEMEVAAEENMTGGETSRLDEVLAALNVLDGEAETDGTGTSKHGF